MVDKLNFPFSWIINSFVRPVQKAADFKSPTEEMIKQEGWHHTKLETADPVQVWDTKAHFKVVYGRHRADGTKYATHEAYGSLRRIKATGEFSACLYTFLEDRCLLFTVNLFSGG